MEGIQAYQICRLVDHFNILFVMAASSANDIIELLEKFLKILKKEQVFDQSGDHPVVQFLYPKDLQDEISFSLENESAAGEKIEEVIRQIIRHSVRTSSPHFHNEFYAGFDQYGLAGSWLTEVLNTSMNNYEEAPVFTLMEKEVIKASLKLMGYPQSLRGEGIMTPDGNISMMYAMVLARNNALDQNKIKGIQGDPPLVCFTSDASHYSVTTAADWLGLGTNNVYKIKTDRFGRMLVSDLKRAIKKAIQQRKLPFFVNATAGTPVFGAVDPLREIATICWLESIWFHVDARVSGTLRFSKGHRHRLRGIERSNSVTWSPHNMLGAPYQCSLILTRNRLLIKHHHHVLLSDANNVGVEQHGIFYKTDLDTDVKSIQCSRKVDAMKFWLMWKARGTIGLRQSVDQAMYCAKYFLKQIKKTVGFRSVLDRYDTNIVCFWYVIPYYRKIQDFIMMGVLRYIPPRMRNQEETLAWWKRLYAVTAEIKKRLILEGSLMITYASLPQQKLSNFFRMALKCHPPPTKSSMDYILNQIERAGADVDEAFMTSSVNELNMQH
ncbi:cysteine sulfinic acid decarboxylase-like isoform X1 [Temnothorax longispinosus]|uniref:cysteine sulfinic acid decarboxylase-like isoform X1 n=1 Tax=Temnothorax longispinosus TaxID=300112 RepID=UPI003A9A1024